MPTLARKHQLQGNLLYHVINRANSRTTIFHEKPDFDYFKMILRKYIRKYDIQVYHWVIMPNHYHLLIEILDPSYLPSLMAGINKSYTSYHHKTFDTYGFLWQGRYKSQPVQKDQYLLACGRYIERNPVSAGIVATAEHYPHSSAGYYVNNQPDGITTPSAFYLFLGENPDQRQKAYKLFLMNFDEDEQAYFDNIESPVGNELFRNKLVKQGDTYMPRRAGRIKTTHI